LTEFNSLGQKYAVHVHCLGYVVGIVCPLVFFGNFVLSRKKNICKKMKNVKIVNIT